LVNIIIIIIIIIIKNECHCHGNIIVDRLQGCGNRLWKFKDQLQNNLSFTSLSQITRSLPIMQTVRIADAVLIVCWCQSHGLT